jgi:hypothetical protein
MKIFQWMIGVFLGILPLNLQGLDYIIQDLGTLTADESHAAVINNQNTIVGYTKQANEVSNFIWKQNEGLVLLPYPNYQLPLINNLNQVTDIFWHRTKTNYWFATNTDTRSKHIYIYDNGILQDLGSPEQWEIQKIENWQTASAWDNKELGILSFNDNQQILIANAKQVNKATRFAIWQNGVFKEIDTNVISNAYEMNNQGLILARKWMQKENINVPMLVLYNPLEETIIEITKDVNIINRKLNDQGQVIVLQGLKNPAECKGFLWDSEKGVTEFEDFAPVAFNNCNQIIGFQISEILNKNFVPLMWTASEVISLTQFIKSGGIESIWSEVTSIDGINDNGYIIGEGLFDGKKHAFVLVPQ